MDSIKRALKSIFKRGKKKDQQQQQQEKAKPTSALPTSAKSTTQQQQQSSSQPPPPPAKDTPPKIGALAGLGEQEEGKTDSPPTHPLATGRHEQAKATVPQDHAAKPGPAAPEPTVAGGPEGLGRARDDSAPVSAVSSLPQNAEGSQATAPSSVAQEEEKVQENGVADAVQAAPVEAAVAAPAVTESQPSHVQSTGEPEAPPSASHQAQQVAPAPTTTAAATKENALPQPNGTTPTTSTEPAKPLAATKPNARVDEDKIPVSSEEPPPIKSVQAAPGMSATSGPLEDFPEGGDYRD